MKIIQLTDTRDPELIGRQQMLDHQLLSRDHEVETWVSTGHSITAGERTFAGRALPAELERADADLLHVYALSPRPADAFAGLTIPWIAPSTPKSPWFRFGRGSRPDALVVAHPAFSPPESPPEAVGQPWRDAGLPTRRPPPAGHRTVGSVIRAEDQAMLEAVRSRISRTRDDLVWRRYTAAPAPSDLAELDVWVDLTGSEQGPGSFVPEALVSGLLVVACRTPLNTDRLEGGASGFLVPPDDANEMAHVILTALFKPDLAAPRLEAARSSAGRFDPTHRLDYLERIYRKLTRSHS